MMISLPAATWLLAFRKQYWSIIEVFCGEHNNWLLQMQPLQGVIFLKSAKEQY